MSPAERIAEVRSRFPDGGLFRAKEWVMSPDAFPLERGVLENLQALGPALRSFQKACNRLYFASLETAELKWVAQWLDQGKPEEVVALGREARWRDDLPRVLRPDLVLTESGVTIAELDSLPGGIGLTGWLNETYAALGQEVIGGADGMIAGFGAAFPHEDVLTSRESGDYQPEMEWLVEKLNERGSHRRVLNSWNLTAHELAGTSLYRFFELFDLANVS